MKSFPLMPAVIIKGIIVLAFILASLNPILADNQTESKKDEGARYFSISPGVNLTDNTLRIGDAYGTSVLVQKNDVVPSWFLDFRSSSYAFTDNFGAYLWVKNSFFVLDRQRLPSPGLPADSSSSDGSGSGGSDSGKTSTYVADTGTRMRGVYNAFLPSVYWGDRFKLGAGAGFSRLQLDGNYQSELSILPLLSLEYVNQGRNPDKLNLISAYYMASGLTSLHGGDPAYAYLIANLPSNSALEQTGLYLLAKGHRPEGQDLFFMSLFMMSAARQRISLSPIEAYALSALATNTIREKETRAFTWTIFADVLVIKGLHLNANIMQSAFNRAGRSYHFDTMDLTMYYAFQI